MAITGAKIKGVHLKTTDRDLDRYSMGTNVPSYIVDSSNGFYTTEVKGLIIASTTFTENSDPYKTGSMVVAFSDTPDLSEVMVGNYLHIQDCEDAQNIGKHLITGVDDGNDEITVDIRNGITNASSLGFANTMPFLGAYAALCLEATDGLNVNSSGTGGGGYGEITEGITLNTDIEEMTIATSGKMELKLL